MLNKTPWPAMSPVSFASYHRAREETARPVPNAPCNTSSWRSCCHRQYDAQRALVAAGGGRRGAHRGQTVSQRAIRSEASDSRGVIKWIARSYSGERERPALAPNSAACLACWTGIHPSSERLPMRNIASQPDTVLSRRAAVFLLRQSSSFNERSCSFLHATKVCVRVPFCEGL